MSYMICMWRGSSFSMRLTGHFSSASGSTVWLVNANTCHTVHTTSAAALSCPTLHVEPQSPTPGTARRSPPDSRYELACFQLYPHDFITSISCRMG